MRVIMAAVSALFLTSTALAGSKVVVELFTSQGCSSCPPADAFMHELAARDDVIALTMPVDIWDYLGWQDTFAKHEFTQRQAAYAPQMPSRSVYTPQMVVGGQADVVGSRRDDALHLIETVTSLGAPGADVQLTTKDATISITIPANADLKGIQGTVWVARVLSDGKVSVGDGENRGKAMDYANVVRDLTPVGLWTGDEAHFDVPVHVDGSDADRLAVFVQKDKTGAIIGAAMIDAKAP